MDTNDECAICLIELKNDIITLPCNHKFHNLCMNQWFEYNRNNSCPYCRYDLVQTRIPTVLFDEIIAPDGNIDSLNVHNFRHFYYLNVNTFTDEQVLQFIDHIKIAKALKSSFIICKNYNITRNNGPTFEGEPNFGKLIKICQITYNGVFSCHFQTEKGVQVYHSNCHKFMIAKD